MLEQKGGERVCTVSSKLFLSTEFLEHILTLGVIRYNANYKPEHVLCVMLITCPLMLALFCVTSLAMKLISFRNIFSNKTLPLIFFLDNHQETH